MPGSAQHSVHQEPGFLALLWHMHQPLYRDLTRDNPREAYPVPWVRLHGLRDYYSMAAIVAEFPSVHLTLNVVPVLLWQIQDYVERGATDTALELTLMPAEEMDGEQRETLLSTFFDADWHHQIYTHPRYRQLFEQRTRGEAFSLQDLRDLQMWFNLAWFGYEFRTGSVPLPDRRTASVRRFVDQGRGFTALDIAEMVREQYKVLENIIPLYRELQDAGQVEVSTTPFYHPILPLLIDTDCASLDRPGTSLPKRFAWPEDAEAQVRRAIEVYEQLFGRRPRGMWPAEGAVSQPAISLLAHCGIRWIATDQGVLARSGKWGYRVDDPRVLCQPYRAEDDTERSSLSVFFRATDPSDAVGFRYGSYADDGAAAAHFVSTLGDRYFASRTDAEDRIVTVVLDGENAWGGYAEDGRPFLRSLYAALATSPQIRTATFNEYLEGNSERGVPPHPMKEQSRVYELATGSWIDEPGSLPGVDLGTWIGEAEENRAWELLGKTRQFLADQWLAPDAAPEAFACLFAAEGSDWFWWFGNDQDSGTDESFDELFRSHLKGVYKALGHPHPTVLDQPIVPRTVAWSFTRPVAVIYASDRLTVRTNCPGSLEWWTDVEPRHAAVQLQPAGGVMAGQRAYNVTLPALKPETRELIFVFHCGECACAGIGHCCGGEQQRVQVRPSG